jgi:glycosyltransferase involved in cell wall biosynthesis
MLCAYGLSSLVILFFSLCHAPSVFAKEVKGFSVGSNDSFAFWKPLPKYKAKQGVTKIAKDALWQKLKDYAPKKNRNFLVLIPSYNNKDWYKKNLDSVFMQDYPFYKAVYIDDCSTDGTGDLVEKYIKKHRKEGKFILIKNKERKFAWANQYDAIHACDDENAIVVTLDGDDWWAHDHVLTLINKIYDKFDVWMPYGQYETYPGKERGLCSELPAHIIKTNDFRNFEWVTSQQRTYYVWLFKLIKKEDLLYDGNFFPKSGDLAIMFPMLEMSGERSKFISDVIYIYNKETPLTHTKLNPGFSYSKIIRARKPYSRLEQRPIA